MRQIWTEKEILFLKQKYPQNTATILTKILKRTKIAINCKANSLGIKSSLIGISNKRYYFIENFFSKPNLINSYWAGFIAADGCINDKRHGQKQIRIGLADKDISILKRFKRDIEFTGEVKVRKNSVNLDITSNKLCLDLKNNFNITPRKSLTLKPPKNLTKNCEAAFIIGMIDGDGYIRSYRKNKLRLSLVGTYEELFFVHRFLLKLNKNLIFNQLPIYKKDNVYIYELYSTKAEILLRYLYKLNIQKLNRKWDVVKKVING